MGHRALVVVAFDGDLDRQTEPAGVAGVDGEEPVEAGPRRLGVVVCLTLGPVVEELGGFLATALPGGGLDEAIFESVLGCVVVVLAVDPTEARERRPPARILRERFHQRLAGSVAIVEVVHADLAELFVELGALCTANHFGEGFAGFGRRRPALGRPGRHPQRVPGAVVARVGANDGLEGLDRLVGALVGVGEGPRVGGVEGAFLGPPRMTEARGEGLDAKARVVEGADGFVEGDGGVDAFAVALAGALGPEEGVVLGVGATPESSEAGGVEEELGGQLRRLDGLRQLHPALREARVVAVEAPHHRQAGGHRHAGVAVLGIAGDDLDGLGLEGPHAGDGVVPDFASGQRFGAGRPRRQDLDGGAAGFGRDGRGRQGHDRQGGGLADFEVLAAEGVAELAFGEFGLAESVGVVQPERQSVSSRAVGLDLVDGEGFEGAQLEVGVVGALAESA